MSALTRLQEFTMTQISIMGRVSKACQQNLSLISLAALLGASALTSTVAQASDACRQLSAIESTYGMAGEHKDDFVKHYTKLCQEENNARTGLARVPIQDGSGKALPIQKIEEISNWLKQLKVAEVRFVSALNGEGSLDEAKEDFEEIRVEFIQEIRMLGAFDLSQFRVEANRILSIPTDSPLLYRRIEQENIASRDTVGSYRNSHALSSIAHDGGVKKSARLLLE